MMNMLLTLRFLIVIVMVSCATNTGKDRVLGLMKVKGIENIYIKLFQEEDFDSALALYYEIVDNKDSSIVHKTFLIGTHYYEKDTSNFFINSYDSIIYICYNDKKEVDALYDLKTNKGSNSDYNSYDAFVKERARLFLVLKSNDSLLTAEWEK